MSLIAFSMKKSGLRFAAFFLGLALLAPRSAAAAPPPAPGEPYENSLGMKFVPVPGTNVLFSIWDTRVQDFAQFVRETGSDATAEVYSITREGPKRVGASWRNPGFVQGPAHPVCAVNWQDAKAFCEWLTDKERHAGRLGPNQSYRLPTDAEWSVAVGLPPESGKTPEEKNGKIKEDFPWGEGWPPPPGSGNLAGSETRDDHWPADWNTIAGYQDDFPRTAPVGSFPQNQFGLYDMGGNVLQWCDDWYNDTRQRRVLRGSSFNRQDANCLLSSYRESCPPKLRMVSCGFRCVLVPAP